MGQSQTTENMLLLLELDYLLLSMAHAKKENDYAYYQHLLFEVSSLYTKIYE